MQSFFHHPIAELSNKKILILMNGLSKARGYSSALASQKRKKDIEKKMTSKKLILEKYGLSRFLDLKWPDVYSQKKVDYIRKNPKSIRQMYGVHDLSKLPIFQGGFINFGYWPIPFFSDSEISIEQRIECSKEMYRVIGNLAKILKQNSLLDVGCGLGYGTALLSNHYQPKLVVGVDISADQIARAKNHQISGISSGKLRFTIGEAESLPFTDRSFDSIVSVQAAQHFLCINSFAKEARRIIKPGGKLVITSFFPKSKEGVETLNAIIPDYHIHGSQNTIPDIENNLSAYLEKVKVTSIGENVWHGFSKWLDQIGYQDQWSKIWCALYEKKLIDYVIYEATCPNLKFSEVPDKSKQLKIMTHERRQ